jgi:hypothetical protein
MAGTDAMEFVPYGRSASGGLATREPETVR